MNNKTIFYAKYSALSFVLYTGIGILANWGTSLNWVSKPLKLLTNPGMKGNLKNNSLHLLKLFFSF